jgi:hypothetical protein
MARVRPGDTIALAPGDYREPIVVRQAIAVSGPREAVVRPPLGAPADWTAVIVVDTREARLDGFSIAAADGQPLSIGIRVERSDVRVDDVEISGAVQAAIALTDGARATVSSSLIRDNEGSAIVAGAGTLLHLRHSALLRNGTLPAHPRAAIELAEGAQATLVGNAVTGGARGAIQGWRASDLPSLMRDNLVHPAPPTGARGTPAGAPRSSPARPRR